MYTLYGGWIYEGTGQLPEGKGVKNGRICKVLDTVDMYMRVSGQWVSLNHSFTNPTKSGIITTDPEGLFHVAFVMPFNIGYYTVALTCENNLTYPSIAAYFYNMTVNGFDIVTRNRNGVNVGGLVVSWIATRDFNP